MKTNILDTLKKDWFRLVEVTILLISLLVNTCLIYQQMSHQAAVDTAALVKDYYQMLSSDEVAADAAIHALMTELPTKDEEIKKVIDGIIAYSKSDKNPNKYNQRIRFYRWLIDAFDNDKPTRLASIKPMIDQMYYERVPENIDMIFEYTENQIKDSNLYWQEGFYNCLKVINNIDEKSLQNNGNPDLIEYKISLLRAFVKEKNLNLWQDSEKLLENIRVKCKLPKRNVLFVSYY